MMADYKVIIQHLENCLEKFGDSPKGVDWPNAEDAQTRYQVMLEILQFDRYANGDEKSILDFGCGLGHMLEHMQNRSLNIAYTGLDISEKYIAYCRKKFPDTPFICTDILQDGVALPAFDYAILNGIFTEKVSLTYDEMFEYFTRLVKKVFPLAKRGIAFNVMSKAVDWERDDLFHLPLDVLQNFLVKELGRNFIIRNDYRLYEYTVYLFH